MPTRKEYFRALEDLFIELRGAPLLLSPQDWQTAKAWWEGGVPLSLVEEAVREVFTRRDERREADRVNSLRYCAPAVEKAWRELREIQGPGRRGESFQAGSSEVGGADEKLRDLAARLPEDLPDRGSWQDRICALRGTEAAVDSQLRELEEELMSLLEERSSSEDRAALADEVESGLAAVRARFAESELEAIRERVRRQKLRRRHGVPLLTLFD